MTTTLVSIATATVAKKQDMIAVSGDFKDFIVGCTEIFGASSASKDYMAATQKEICDAMHAFVEANRFSEVEIEVQSRDGDGAPIFEDGEPVMEKVLEKRDGFALEVNRTLALRAATSRANSASAKLAEKDKELQELRAMLAKLQGTNA